MRGQVATIEALLALSLVVGIVSFLASAENSNYLYSYRETRALMESEAVYDFINQVEANYSIGACINSSGQCVYRYLLSYKTLYGLDSIALNPGGRNIGGTTSVQLTKCFPYGRQTLCIMVG